MALEGGEGSASCPGHSLLRGKTQYPSYRRLSGPQGWPGQVRKISSPTAIRSPDRPARSQSLYIVYTVLKSHLFWLFILFGEDRLCSFFYNMLHCYSLTLRLLMSYIYMERLFLTFLDHTQRRSTVGRTPLDE